MFSGVKREVNNLIKENQDLVQTKNALNVVTSDLIGRIDELTCENTRLNSERTALISHTTGMLSRIKDLEHECRRLRQELESEDMCDSICGDSMRDEEHLLGEDESSSEALSMRRHFSRLEMARVLLERNYYKEQWLELQDTVRWTETLRAERRSALRHSSRRRGSLWNWFSRLFTPSKSRRSEVTDTSLNASHGSLSYGSMSAHVESGETAGAEDLSSSQITDDSRTHPSSFSNPISDDLVRPVKSHPLDWVRILNPEAFKPLDGFRYTCHFRPLAESLTGFKLWNAIYVQPHLSPYSPPHEATDLSSSSDQNTPPDRFVWVCSVATGSGESAGLVSLGDNKSDTAGDDLNTAYSLITVYNMNEPYRTADSFAVTSSTVLCMCSVPGDSPETQLHLSQTDSYWTAIPLGLDDDDDGLDSDGAALNSNTNGGGVGPGLVDSLCWSTHSYPLMSSDRRQTRSIASAAVTQHTTTQSCEWNVNLGSSQYYVERRRIMTRQNNEETNVQDSTDPEQTPYTSAEPTVWMGCFNGDVYIHSAVSNWHTCLHVVHLPDAVTQIRHFRGRVFISLANGQLVVFRRHTRLGDGQISGVHHSEGTWNLNEVSIISCNSTPSAIQPTIVVPSTDCIWSACRNRILVIDAITLQLVNSFEVQSNNDAHVRHMCCSGKGVWIALRRLSMLQLYHVITHQHLQTVDLEPLVIGRLVDLKVVEKPHRPIRPSSIAVTCLATTQDDHLWVGTNLGLVLRFPIQSSRVQQTVDRSVTPLSLCAELTAEAPIANVTEVQVSRHQHCGAVRFLTAVDAPSVEDSLHPVAEASMLDSSNKARELMLSGGRGYAFRGSNVGSNRSSSPSSGHVIVWKSLVVDS